MDEDARSVMAMATPVVASGVRKVPFIELHEGRLQGVVSSGSDARRVYASFVEGGSTDYDCSTNNNRPCGGLRGGPCKHIQELMNEAVERFGAARVARYLGLEVEAPVVTGWTLQGGIHGARRREPAGVVFSRFLAYLRQVQREGTRAPVPEMGWFVSG